MSTLFPPFDPSGPRPGRRRVRLARIPIRMVLPNLVTLLALGLGLTSMRLTIEGDFPTAVAAIVAAAILDALDGRLARLLKSTSRFGAELDSLADFVNFGVAPAVLLYGWVLNGAGTLGWIGALVFAICAALRLARFNVMLADDRPGWQSGFFVGVPAPAAALVVLLPLYIDEIGIRIASWGAPLVLVYAAAIGLLMVSRLPTYSHKLLGTRIRRDWVMPILVFAVAFCALLASYPFVALALGSIAYLVALPWGLDAWRRAARAHEAHEAGVAAGTAGYGGGEASRAVRLPAPLAADTPAPASDTASPGDGEPEADTAPQAAAEPPGEDAAAPDAPEPAAGPEDRPQERGRVIRLH